MRTGATNRQNRVLTLASLVALASQAGGKKRKTVILSADFCAKNPSWSFGFNREGFFASLKMTNQKALFPQPVQPVLQFQVTELPKFHLPDAVCDGTAPSRLLIGKKGPPESSLFLTPRL